MSAKSGSPVSALVDALVDNVADDSMNETIRPIVETDGLPSLKYSESDFGSSFSGEQYLKTREDLRLDCSPHKQDTN